MRKVGWMGVLVLAGPVFGAASGRIVAPDGAPVAGAQVCELLLNSPEHCVSADIAGLYKMKAPQRPTLLVRARGFIPMTVDASPLSDPVVLQRAALLLVSVVDGKTGAPLPAGKVMLNAPSGQRIGNYVPFNQSGVRITTLSPGTVFVRAAADGYEPGGPIPVDLVSAKESTVKIVMTKSAKAAH